MSLYLSKKKIVENNRSIAIKSLSAITANISKVTSNEMNQLRKESRKLKIKLFIVKNTLLKKSLLKTHLNPLNSTLKGPTLIAFSMDHPGSASRLFVKFSKIVSQFKINSAVLNGKILSLQEINELALMPTYQESISNLLYLLKELCIGRLHRILHEIKKNIK